MLQGLFSVIPEPHSNIYAVVLALPAIESSRNLCECFYIDGRIFTCMCTQRVPPLTGGHQIDFSKRASGSQHSTCN